MKLVGRDEEVRELIRHPAKVVVLAGDSGVGKSEVLRISQDQSTLALAPPPIALRHAPGALQLGLLESLAAAVAEITKIIRGQSELAEPSLRLLVASRKYNSKT